jgi:hypothetical protein
MISRQNLARQTAILGALLLLTGPCAHRLPGAVLSNWWIPTAAADEKVEARDGQRIAADVSCGALVDAQGAKVKGQGTSEQITTSTSGRCPALETVPKPAAVTAQAKPEPARRAPTEPIPGLSAEPVQRTVETRDGPLGFAGGSPERVGAALLTGGAMIWVLQSSFWTSLLVLGLPLWRHVDLLPIVASAPDNEAETAEAAPSTPEEVAVARVLDGHSTRTGANQLRS